MENDTGVRKLVELIFGKKPSIPEEMAAHSSIISDVLTEDFSKKMKDILRMHKVITYEKWIHYFDCFYREMLSSHQKYLAGLIYVCLYEHKCNRNIFDSFVSAFLLVMNISNEVLTKAGIDFRDLNPDIIMIFYRNILKRYFLEHGGFYGFVEYVCGHKYFEWNWDENDLKLFDGETVLNNFTPNLDENIVKEYNSYLNFKGPSKDTTIAMAESAMRMAQEVLSTTSVDLPTLLSESDLNNCLVAYRKKQLATKTERNGKAEPTSTFETAHGDLCSNSVSKTNYVAQQQENIARHENIIEAVIRHNHSNIYHHGNVKNPKQVEAERTLENFKTSIEFLIEVLDECDKE